MLNNIHVPSGYCFLLKGAIIQKGDLFLCDRGLKYIKTKELDAWSPCISSIGDVYDTKSELDYNLFTIIRPISNPIVKQENKNMNTNTTICQYVKNKKGNLIGCVAGVNGKVGWSKCNVKAGDVFNKERALQIAVGRATVNPVKLNDFNHLLHSNIPHDMHSVIYHFLNDRCPRYFKQNLTSNKESV